MLFWFHTNKKGSRFLVWVVLKCQRQTLKTIWQSSINNLCARTPQTRVGEVGFSLHFWVSVNFYPPNCRFPAPNFSLKPWMLRARKVSKSYFQEPTPQPFDGWAGSYFPHCSVKKKGVLPIWHVQNFSSWRKLTVDMCFQVVRKIVSDPAEMQNNFWWRFFDDWFFLQTRTFSERITIDIFACDRYGYIYVYLYFLYTTRLLFDSDKVIG